MTAKRRKEWEAFLGKLLEENEESAGATGIRADLCIQILEMSKSELFDFCQDIESIPGVLNKPELAMNCEACRKEYGSCIDRYGDVDYKNCEKRFWNCAEKWASQNE